MSRVNERAPWLRRLRSDISRAGGSAQLLRAGPLAKCGAALGSAAGADE